MSTQPLLPSREHGAVLPVSLFILVIVTLLVVSSMDTSNTGLRIAYNKQARMQAEMESIRTAELVLSDWLWFTPADQAANFWEAPPAALGSLQNMDGDATTTEFSFAAQGDGFTRWITQPVCIGAEDDPLGYDTDTATAPQRVYWEFDSIVEDTISGARAVTTHGVRMRMIRHSCTSPLS